MHAEVTGLGEYLAENDAHAIALARELIDQLQWDTVPAPAAATAPRFDREELLGVVPADEREPYDVREVIARVVDGSDFLEFKASLAADTVCGHARIHGQRVGILGNNGPIQPAGSTKAAQFIQLCDQTGTPLIFLQNTTGYMVGKAAEQAGAIKHGSKMIQAVANGARAQVHHRAGRQLWRGQLRHVRPRLRPALHLQLAQRPHRGDGRRAGRQGDGHRQPQQAAEDGPAGQRRGAGRDERRAAPPAGRGKPGAVRHRAAVGRRRDRPARHAPRAGPVPAAVCARPRPARCTRTASAWPASERPPPNPQGPHEVHPRAPPDQRHRHQVRAEGDQPLRARMGRRPSSSPATKFSRSWATWACWA